MTRQNYGQTWWGAQWLNALTQIDYDNRLPRGRSYANKGAVRNLTVQGGSIQARVKGSRAQPYRVTIRVPPIPGDQTSILLDQVAADPVMIARLLNLELDPTMLELAARLGITVFPSRWKDLDMRCSCPDWAVPCKHLAAVIYLLSREIDGNPFLVFSLRGIDLAQALKSHDIHIEREAAATLPTVADLLHDSALTAPDNEAVQPHDATPLPVPFDLSTLPALLDPLTQVLQARPACFAGGDLKTIYRQTIAKAARQARRVISTTGRTAHGAPAAIFHHEDQPHIEISDQYIAELHGLGGINDWPELTAALDTLQPGELLSIQPELAALYDTRIVALHLLAAGAVTAEIFSLGGQSVGLRWLPALLDPQVRACMQHLSAALPADIVTHRPEHGHSVSVPANAQAIVLCSLFLDAFIRQWSGTQNARPAGDKTLDLFFISGRTCYDGPGEGAMAVGIQGWFARHHIAHHAHTPVICLNETPGGDLAITIAIGEPAAGTAPAPLSSVLEDAAWGGARFGILRDISLLAEFFPPLNAYARDGARMPIVLPIQRLPELLQDILPVIRLLGIPTLLPSALERLLRPRLSLRMKGNRAADAAGAMRSDGLFDFDWRVALGQHQLTRSQFEKLVTGATKVIRFKSEYVYLDPGDIARLRTQLDEPPRMDSIELLRIALDDEFQGTAVALDVHAKRILRELTETGEISLPRGIAATLRPYQRSGYAWLYRNARLGFGSIIADDMGLGKTLQVIATLQRLKEDSALDQAQALVVVPTSLITNWQKEITRFAPDLTVSLFHGNRRELTTERSDVLLTSYGVARREAVVLKTMAWRILVVDEAQNIKNPAAAQTKAIKSIPAHSFIAMSGTPVENRLSEYWSIMDFANRGYLGSLSAFIKEYATPIQTQHDARVIKRFQRVMAPFLLRRLKSDKQIIDDLPDKIEQNQYCTLTPTQTALYESVVREGLRVIQGVSDSFRRQGLVLQLMLALKQICNHPALYLKQSDTKAQLSGKAARFLELIDNIRSSREKVLVFTQFRAMGELLSEWIRGCYGQAPLFLHGGVSRTQRDAMVERFQNDRTEQVFLLSLKAGGTGLNLTAATHVIHYDLWWNPAVEAQATDRAYRIGQHANVQVHRLITRGTLEEHIDELIQAKRVLANLAVGTGEKWIGTLDETELEQLFTLNG